MKLLLRYTGIKAAVIWEEFVKSQLGKLQKLAAIASAKVLLECRSDTAPRFRVETYLEVPGPDFHAEAKDNTLRAAMLKVVKDLEKQIRSRTSRRADKRNTNIQLGLLPGRTRLSAGGLRA